jgi:hypothetical protein
MKKQIILTLETSEILPSNGKPTAGFNLMIGDTCDANDVKIMASMFINWYVQNGSGPKPPPKVDTPNRVEGQV